MPRPMKNSKREQKKWNEEGSALIMAALEHDIITRVKISESTGLKLHEITKLFADNPNVFAEFTLRRRTIVDLAADNIQEIVADKTHPQHFQASKYILANFKSDLDETLDKQDGDEITVKRRGKGGRSRVRFDFGKNKD